MAAVSSPTILRSVSQKEVVRWFMTPPTQPCPPGNEDCDEGLPARGYMGLNTLYNCMGNPMCSTCGSMVCNDLFCSSLNSSLPFFEPSFPYYYVPSPVTSLYPPIQSMNLIMHNDPFLTMFHMRCREFMHDIERIETLWVESGDYGMVEKLLAILGAYREYLHHSAKEYSAASNCVDALLDWIDDGYGAFSVLFPSSSVSQ